jgi:short-subunit dehydrogenase
MQHFIPQGYGKLINIMGRGDKKPASMQNAYSSTKAWVRSFTIALADEYKTSGVGVYAFNPGMMTTDMLTQLDAVVGFEHRLKAMPTIIRMWTVRPEVSAKKVVWLGSSETDGRTGLLSWQMNKVFMLKGALREGLRRLFRQSAPPVEVDINTIPSTLPEG